jgi:MFS family permease
LTPEADPAKPAKDETPSVAVKGERLILLTVMLGVFLAPLNSTMIAVALPSIMLDFDVGISSAGWLITAYLIAMASLQPLAGKLGDRFGHRTMVLSGLTVFGFVSVGAAVAPTLLWLLVFRVFQAVSAALIIPNGSALLREILPADRRGAGFGVLGAGIAVAAAIGPPLGGVLVEAGGWRSIFYVNLLMVVPAILIGLKHLPRAKAAAAKTGVRHLRSHGHAGFAHRHRLDRDLILQGWKPLGGWVRRSPSCGGSIFVRLLRAEPSRPHISVQFFPAEVFCCFGRGHRVRQPFDVLVTGVDTASLIQ